jgi:hypothetical protein
VATLFKGWKTRCIEKEEKNHQKSHIIQDRPIHDNRCSEERKEKDDDDGGNHDEGKKKVDKLPRTSVVLLLLVVVAELPFTLCRHPTLCLHHLLYLIGTALVPLGGIEALHVA